MTTDPPLQPIMQKPGQAPPLASRALSPLRINSPKFADLSPSQASADRTSYFSPFRRLSQVDYALWHPPQQAQVGRDRSVATCLAE